MKYLFPDTSYNFISQVATAWAKVNFHSPTDINGMAQQPIAFNSHIRRANRPLDDKRTGNLKYVGQLFAEKRLLTLEEIQCKYDVRLTFLDHIALTRAIPIVWKQNLKDLTSQEIESSMEVSCQLYDILEGKPLTKEVYWKRIEILVTITKMGAQPILEHNGNCNRITKSGCAGTLRQQS